MRYELHGDTGTRLYRIWKTMKCRCNDSNHPTYKWYGARGIRVCGEWSESYISFREWAITHGYKEGLELERIDVNKGYNPDNCNSNILEAKLSERMNMPVVVIGGKKKVI